MYTGGEDGEGVPGSPMVYSKFCFRSVILSALPKEGGEGSEARQTGPTPYIDGCQIDCTDV